MPMDFDGWLHDPTRVRIPPSPPSIRTAARVRAPPAARSPDQLIFSRPQFVTRELAEPDVTVVTVVTSQMPAPGLGTKNSRNVAVLGWLETRNDVRRHL